jgi:deoxycytidylate deaminase
VPAAESLLTPHSPARTFSSLAVPRWRLTLHLVANRSSETIQDTEPDAMEPALRLDLKGVENPELVFGLVGPLGSPMTRVTKLLSSGLDAFGYNAEEIRLSNFLSVYGNLPTPHPAADDPPFKRWMALMSRGNELREQLKRGDALAMHAAAAINQKRPQEGSRALEQRAFVLRQLKHPEEVRLLRQVYGDAFHLVGVHTPEGVRHGHLRNVENVPSDQVDKLLERDAGEELDLGQQVTKTFHLADLFVMVMGWKDESFADAEQQISRYLDLLFGRGIVTPSPDEYGMFLAASAALRSSDLSRQVGAAILTQQGEVIALGANEVPRAGGGQYWEGDQGDERDCVRGYDSNERIELECVKEVLETLDPEHWKQLSAEGKEHEVQSTADKLANTRLMNLTEFGRSVHAEMEAILSAGRVGVSVKGHTLFTTTFPWHNCAKHIVGAGIHRVIYVEPYSKSLADRLHGDAIAFSLDTDALDETRIPFEPFRGVAPRRFPTLFSTIEPYGVRLKRKDDGGDIKTTPIGLRSAVTPLTHVDREAIVADHLMNQVMEGLPDVPPTSEEPT